MFSLYHHLLLPVDSFFYARVSIFADFFLLQCPLYTIYRFFFVNQCLVNLKTPLYLQQQTIMDIFWLYHFVYHHLQVIRMKTIWTAMTEWSESLEKVVPEVFGTIYKQNGEYDFWANLFDSNSLWD